MRSRFLLLAPLLLALSFPASASAYYDHTVMPGESLASVAAADGLSVDQLAAANGLSSDSYLVSGTALQIPPQSAGTVTSAAPATGEEAGETVPDGDETSATATPASTTAAGGYLVQPGDTLSSIAAANGLTVNELAAANGLNPAGILISGTHLEIAGSSAAAEPTAQTEVTPVASVTPASETGAQPTAESVSPTDVGQIAADNGVSPSLAEAIGYQESGFNNGLVSRTGATGVMQIEPQTWSYIGQNLATPPPLSSDSAQDNIRGGVLLLHSLLDETGGDPGLAAAGYYQGLASVRAHGMYSDTQRYVNDVLALRSRFGGP